MIRLSKGAVAGFKAKPLETFFDGAKGLAAGWYKCTRNPLFAWEVLAAHLERDDQLQLEVKTYFSDVGKQLIEISGPAVPSKEKRKAVADCVIPPGKGRDSSFAEFKLIRRNWAIVCSVEEMQGRSVYVIDSKTMEDIYCAVAVTCNLTWERVQEIYNENNLNDQVSVEFLGPVARKKRKKRFR
jgi:hypothetical protein